MKKDTEKTEQLLREYDEQRDALKLMIKDLEKIKVRIETLFPESLDMRYIRVYEEKMKSLSSLFQVLLDIRKEILKSVKDELEIRKRIELGQDVEDSLDDIRNLAKKVEKIQKDEKKAEVLLEQKLSEVTS